MVEYSKPEITDFGTLIGLTEAIAIGGIEDGASKQTTPAHHQIISLPLN